MANAVFWTSLAINVWFLALTVAAAAHYRRMWRTGEAMPPWRAKSCGRFMFFNFAAYAAFMGLGVVLLVAAPAALARNAASLR